MSQNYQSQDVWSRATSVNGYAFDELRSVLQKSIRRGWIEEAVLAAYEFFSSGSEAEEVLWRRLEIIATEDVGFGLIDAPAILEALNAQRLRMVDRGDRWMYSVHAVRLLASAKKDNTTMELATWAQFAVARGERRVEVQDFEVDMHTRQTREQARPGANQVGQVPGRALHGSEGCGDGREKLMSRLSGTSRRTCSRTRSWWSYDGRA
jgi:replication-associated recombination protein RarA